MNEEELRQAFEKKETGKWNIENEVFLQCPVCYQLNTIPAMQKKVLCIICKTVIQRES